MLNGMWSGRQRGEVMPQLQSSAHLSTAIIIHGNPGHTKWSRGKLVTTSKRLAWNNTAALQTHSLLTSVQSHTCTNSFFTPGWTLGSFLPLSLTFQYIFMDLNMTKSPSTKEKTMAASKDNIHTLCVCLCACVRCWTGKAKREWKEMEMIYTILSNIVCIINTISIFHFLNNTVIINSGISQKPLVDRRKLPRLQIGLQSAKSIPEQLLIAHVFDFFA